MIRSEIILAVKARLDELTPFQESDVALGDGLVKPVEQYIDDFLDEATDAVRLLCPEYRMEAKGFGSVSLSEQTLGNEPDIVFYKFTIPEYFLKIAEVRMANWERPCYAALPAGGEAYKLLRNPHTTAGPAKPAVVVTGGNIELYGSRVSGIELDVGTYIDSRHYDETDATMAQDALVDNAIIWRCALLVFGVMGRAEVLKQAEVFYMESMKQL
jgi:hypothetical protein